MTLSLSFKVRRHCIQSLCESNFGPSRFSLRCFALEFTTRLNGLNLAFRPCGALNLGNPRAEGERQTTKSWAGFLSFNFMFVALAPAGESTVSGCTFCVLSLLFSWFGVSSIRELYRFSCVCFETVFLNHSWNLFRYFSGFLHPSPAATEAWTNRLHRHIPSGEILSCGEEGRSAITPKGFCQCWK